MTTDTPSRPGCLAATLISQVVVPPPPGQPVVVIPPPAFTAPGTAVVAPVPVAQAEPAPVQPAAGALPASQQQGPAGAAPSSSSPAGSAGAATGGSSAVSGGTAGTPNSVVAPQGAPTLASNTSGTVTPDGGSASSADSDATKSIPPVLPTAAPQPLLIRITSVGGYEVCSMCGPQHQGHYVLSLEQRVYMCRHSTMTAQYPLSSVHASSSRVLCFPELPQVNKQGSVWTARTSASPDKVFLRPQSRSRIAFTVDYSKSSLASGSYLVGSVTVTNPNPQVVNAPGLTLAIAGQGSGGSSGTTRSSSGSSTAAANTLEAQVDCSSGQGNLRTPMPFKVPSGGSITCT